MEVNDAGVAWRFDNDLLVPRILDNQQNTFSSVDYPRLEAGDINAGNKIETKQVIMGKNYYNIDYINKYIPDQYREVAINFLIEQEKKGIYGAPTDSKRITSPVCSRTDAKPEEHTGIDIGALKKEKRGDPIYAIADGKVLRNGLTKSKSTRLEQSLPYTNDTAVYQHAEFIVEEGDSVKRGQIIGYMSDKGTPGQIHLHFEIRKDGKYVDKAVLAEDPRNHIPLTYYIE